MNKNNNYYSSTKFAHNLKYRLENELDIVLMFHNKFYFQLLNMYLRNLIFLLTY